MEVGDGARSTSSSFEDVEVDGECWRAFGDGFVETEGLEGCFGGGGLAFSLSAANLRSPSFTRYACRQ